VYRSGKVSPAQLAEVAREHGVKRVLSLLDPAAPESVAERDAAARLGIEWLNVPLRGNGASTPEARDRIREILAQRDKPLLIHCAAGSNRTGLACGMLRIHEQGWTVEQVIAEMKTYDFEDEPDHENLRQALLAEQELARQKRSAASP
jgi:protein tyrosine phosphatase (PTP) superfamily phosphohydrolase (DUF442 family)